MSCRRGRSEHSDRNEHGKLNGLGYIAIAPIERPSGPGLLRLCRPRAGILARSGNFAAGNADALISLRDCYIKALTFDTGGTILDWHAGLFGAIERVGQRCGLGRLA